jgi:twitching motility protein PilT
MGEKLRVRFEQKNEVDLAFSVANGAAFRANIYTQRGLVNLALRVIPSVIPTIQSPWGCRRWYKKWRTINAGSFWSAARRGPASPRPWPPSSITSTSTRKAHILTIEDPIEFVHKNKKSIVNQRELGLDTHSYADALRSAMREDPT